MKVTVYQIKLGHEYKFCGYDEIVKAQNGRTEIDASIYEEVYSGELDCENLEDVFYLLNHTHPDGYKGHSLSVSDVIKTDEGFFFCDKCGFKEIQFLKKNEKPKVRFSGQDGNVFNLLGICRNALRKAGMTDAAEEMTRRIESIEDDGQISGYDRAIQIMMEYCDVE